jgi:hypothetical protein
VSGVNTSLWVIELWKKKGSYSAVFKEVKMKLLGSKFILESGHQSYRKIALQQIFPSQA